VRKGDANETAGEGGDISWTGVRDGDCNNDGDGNGAEDEADEEEVSGASNSAVRASLNPFGDAFV
jgi:hypothetical protein